MPSADKPVKQILCFRVVPRLQFDPHLVAFLMHWISMLVCFATFKRNGLAANPAEDCGSPE